jgi:formylglycine-generating enzyme required for sulfatase activity
VGGKAPVIIQEPQDLTVRAGSNAVFTVVAEGTGPLVYQWFFDGETILGSRQSRLILTNVHAVNAGNYWVRITNSVGTVTSSFANLTVEAGNPIGTEDFVWIPPGTFVMGSPFGEPGRGQDENLHSVILTRGFWISDHEVTQEEYEALMENNPSTFRGDLNLPVESVTWHDAVTYCSRLTERERSAGRITAQQAYRLPTEAEWEYSARSGTTSLRYGNLMDIAWHSENSGGKSQPVRQKNPNNWGLYDMLGNVAEWCSDRKGAYPSGTVTDPESLNIATTARVIRGGYFVLGGGACRSAARFSSGPSDSGNGVGFRPVLSAVR